MSFNKGFNGGFDFTFLKLGNASEPVANYVARLDGVTQYWQLSEPITIPQGGSIEFDLYRPQGFARASEYVVSGESDTNTVIAFGGKSSLFVGSSGYLTDLTVDGDAVSVAPADGSFYKISAVSTTNLAEVKNLGCRFNFERLFLGAFKDLIVRDSQGEIINHIPLTNKTQGATQLATVGNVNATMINYTGDEWEVVEDEPVINDVARLDGATQCWYFDKDYIAELGDTIRFKYIGPENPESDICILGRESNYSGALIYRARDGGIVESNGVSLTVDGQYYPGGSLYPKEAKVYSASCDINSLIKIRSLMGAARNKDIPTFTWFFAGVIYDFEIIRNGEVIHSIPLTNKAQGATQIATVGDINATMLNYTGDEWEKLQ